MSTQFTAFAVDRHGTQNLMCGPDQRCDVRMVSQLFNRGSLVMQVLVQELFNLESDWLQGAAKSRGSSARCGRYPNSPQWNSSLPRSFALSVERGGGIPTAFRARIQNGAGPKVGLLVEYEYDALPSLYNDAVPYRQGNRRAAIIRAHTERVTTIFEAIIREGIEVGEFKVEDPAEAARAVKNAFALVRLVAPLRYGARSSGATRRERLESARAARNRARGPPAGRRQAPEGRFPKASFAPAGNAIVQPPGR